MRTEKSIKNSLAAIIVNISTMIIGFIAQAIFIRILGAEYLGLNGLFNNILSMLAYCPVDCVCFRDLHHAIS